MRVAAEPELHHVGAQTSGATLVRRDQRAPGGAAAKRGCVAMAEPQRAAATTARRRRSARCRVSSARVRPVPAGDGDAVAVHDEILDPRAELQRDVGVARAPLRAAPPAGRRDGSPSRARRSALRRASPSGMRASIWPRAAHDRRPPPARPRRRCSRSLEPERDQHARRIGRELDAGAGLFQPLGLLEHDDAEAALRQRQRRGQPADPGAGDDDGARGRHGVSRAAARSGRLSVSAQSGGRAACGSSAGSWR